MGQTYVTQYEEYWLMNVKVFDGCKNAFDKDKIAKLK